MPFRSFPRRTTASQELFGAPTQDKPQSYLVAHIDGGARGNPGPAGYGVVLEDEKGRPVAQLHKYLGRQTNNYAEYSGLLAALEYAVTQGYNAIEILSDSELLVKQMKGVYKVRNEGLRPLYERAQQYLRGLGYFAIRHVRREQNKEADRLANVAMDEGARRA